MARRARLATRSVRGDARRDRGVFGIPARTGGAADAREPRCVNGFPITNAAALLVLLVVINGFGEETGWRGFLLPALQRKRSPLVASLLVAACWAPWHIPAFFVADTFRTMPIAMIPMWLLGLVSGSILLAWLYNRGSRSVVLVAAFHGAFNLLSGTVGAPGPIAAVESTAVMVVAAVLAIQELRATRQDRSGHVSHHAMAPRIPVH